MNPETPKSPREELEARLTALLLGELSADEAAAVHQAIAQDAELAQLHNRLKQAVELVRETVSTPAGEPTASPTPLRLSAERREKLLAQFKTVKPREFSPPRRRRRWEMPWFVPMSAAAALVVLVGSSILLVPMASRLQLMEGVGPLAERVDPLAYSERAHTANAVQSPDFDTDRAAAGESRARTRWFAKSAEPAAPAATPAPPPPAELPVALPVPSEPKVTTYAIALPETTGIDESINGRFANGVAVNWGRQVQPAGGLASAPSLGYGGGGGFGGFGGAGGYVGVTTGSGKAAGQTMLWDEQRELARTERFVQAGDAVAATTQAGLAPLPLKYPAATTKGTPEDVPAGPNLEPLEETLRMKGGALVTDTAKTETDYSPRLPAVRTTPPPPASEPMPALQLAERGEVARERVAEVPARTSRDAGAVRLTGITSLDGKTKALTDVTAKIDEAPRGEIQAVPPPTTATVLAFEVEKNTVTGSARSPAMAAGGVTAPTSDERILTEEMSGAPAQLAGLEKKNRVAVDAKEAQLGQRMEEFRKSEKKLSLAENEMAARHGKVGAGEFERMGLMAGKGVTVEGQPPVDPATGLPVAAEPAQSAGGVAGARGETLTVTDDFFARPTESRRIEISGQAALGDTPMLGRLFQTTRGYFDNGLAGPKAPPAPAKPATAPEERGKQSTVGFGVSVVDGEAPVKLQTVDALSASGAEQQNLFSDFSTVTTGTTGAKDGLRRWEGESHDYLYFGQDGAARGRAGSNPARPTGQVYDGATVYRFTDRYDAKEKFADKAGERGLGTGTPSQVAAESVVTGVVVTNAIAAQVVGYESHAVRGDEPGVAGAAALRESALMGLDASIASSKPAQASRQKESLLRQRVEIALPTAQPEEGRPVGERSAGRYAFRDLNRAESESKPADLEQLQTAPAAEEVTKVADEATPVRRPAPNVPIPQPEVQTADNAFSTFSLNVSDVSFKLAAASLEQGKMPDPSTVRSEEFINAFDYRDPEPAPGMPIAFAWERARYPFAHNRDLLRFSVKTAAAGRQPGRFLNLVLLLDNSGSMERADRVRIIQECLRVLATQLQPQDRISVVTFARTPRLWVDGLAGSQAAQMAEQVGGLTPQGGTNLEEAMNLAYQTALRHYIANGVNRVVVLTDGAANLGDVDPENLKKKVESFRKQGIALDCFGIGWEGYNDDLLEVLSRNGDGRYGFVNTPEAAATEFAGQLAGALQVAASDVKVQVEFNPKRVTAYRQIGYAKHQLKKEQFRDNTVDAAEIGAAEAGNALYVAEVNPRGEGPLAIVRVRFKVPGTQDYREHEWTVPFDGPAMALEQASPAMRLAATSSAFSEWLVASPFAGEVTPDALIGYLSGVPDVFGADERPKKLEWMIRQAKSIAGR